MKYRYRVLAMLFFLAIITYLDRVCISVAGPRIQESLHISPAGWGWVVGAFSFSYCLFEIPSGYLGDRIGPRRVLTRIVLWWSAFTSLTGIASNYAFLLLTRFCFGAGEAGAYPNAAVSIARWFPSTERARAFGIVWMASHVGGALSPLLVVPIQMRYGWRASFYVFGGLGVLWSAVWYGWYRDTPAEKPKVTPAEIEDIGAPSSKPSHGLPWSVALRSKNLWTIMLTSFFYAYGAFFFLTWLHTYLVKGRGFSEHDLLLSALPFLFAACADVSGGITSDALVRKLGLKWGRRAVGIVGLGSAALFTLAAVLTTNKYLLSLSLGLVYAGIRFQSPTVFAVCIDIARKYAGVVTGAMNTAATAGGFLMSVSFGYLVEVTGSYNLPLLPMALMLVIAAALWLKIDATEELIPESQMEVVDQAPQPALG